jgi:hypothetical protein
MPLAGVLFILVIGVCFCAFIFSFLFGIAKYFRLHFRRVDCPVCGKSVPLVSVPTSSRQARLSGWTCAQCGAELDEMGVDMSPLIEAARQVDETPFRYAMRHDGGTPVERVIEERDN